MTLNAKKKKIGGLDVTQFVRYFVIQLIILVNIHYSPDQMVWASLTDNW